MKKGLVLFCGILFLFCCSSCSLIEVCINKSVQEKIVEFDYSKYFPPKVFDAINSSQGTIICSDAIICKVCNEKIASGGGATQGLVIDAEKGLILSVAHSILNPTIMAIEPGHKGHEVEFRRELLFVFGNKFLPVEPKFLDKSLDLAIFQVKNLKNLPKWKSAVFSKDVKTFSMYYAFMRLFAPRESSASGFSLVLELPFQSRLVGKYEYQSGNIKKESFYFDNPCKDGFSGSVLFDKKGRVVGMLNKLDHGFSVAIPNVILTEILEDFIKQYNSQ